MSQQGDSSQHKKAPTINDVAALAGVSKKTVSRFINRSPLMSAETREKVSGAIEQLGYVPNPQARALALRRNFMIALLHDNPNAQTVLNFQKGVLSAIKDTELALAVRPVDRTSPGLLEDVESFLAKQRPIGVLILPPVSESDDIVELCRRLKVNYVRVGSTALDTAEHCVASNDREIVTQLISALLERGHKKIGFVRGPEGFRSPIEREAGFRDAFADAGVEPDPALIVQGNYRFESGLEAGKLLLDRPERPSAIFASNDEMASGVLHAAYRLGLEVPSDVELIGFDDSPTASHVWPPLTTVHWPVEEMGYLAGVKLAADFLRESPNKADLRQIVVPSHIIERASAKLPKV
ncbi:LacI family DNA-binding transcriptional regulator [Altererythrobacter ishigakiensis]|uniref:LacI family transcriptional regulator n=1 Tax=Altererythrobacter ishigakiensis TaxID=476157 RepID=A0A562UM37_9SPHN|nr:LacI family DNA-binding transcriptional regulator [Altererythrobacter ishigakiensis]TWJ06678.1 LacI family transcriptional regulator [Altererythrobacter ishigakiensis]